jgi:MEMO1 family protein
MKQGAIKIYLTILVILVAGALIAVIIDRSKISQVEVVLGKSSENSEVIELTEMFFNDELFGNAILSQENTKGVGNIKAIVVPHHLVAADSIAKIIKMSSGRPIDQIIIIGPNHENAGVCAVNTVSAEWATPFGNVSTDDELVSDLAASTACQDGIEVFNHEHSVGAIMPFIKYYLPDASVVPVSLSSYTDMEKIEGLVDWIKINQSENSLIIVSVDFSHYLDINEADANDEITKDLINDKDLDRILLLNNDYVDSPASLVSVLLYAKDRILKIEFIDHTNSFDFAIEKPSETTSHFTIAFTE